jgi:hypothetical protein
MSSGRSTGEAGLSRLRFPATFQPMQRLIPVAVIASLTACATAFPGARMPQGLTPAQPADLATGLASTRPAGHVVLRFRWHLIADGGSGGRGSVLVAPPDSLRLDFRVSLGLSSGAAAVVGDSALWAEPSDEVQKFVASYPLLWAMVGVARPPQPGWTVESYRDAGRTAWRYSRGNDRVEYILHQHGGSILDAKVRTDGHMVGHVITVFDAAGHLLRSRLDVLTTQARLDITFDKDPKQVPFNGESWLAPRAY